MQESLITHSELSMLLLSGAARKPERDDNEWMASKTPCNISERSEALAAPPKVTHINEHDKSDGRDLQRKVNVVFQTTKSCRICFVFMMTKSVNQEDYRLENLVW